MTVYTLTLGAYQVNCYILHRDGDRRCAVIDPGYEPEKILAFLREKELRPEAILLTHGHFDHVGGVRALAMETDCRVFVRKEETAMPLQFTGGSLYFTDNYPENGQLPIAGMDFLVLHTPGHTPGSVCLMAEDILLSGDTLFAGSCGRTDLPGGDWATIQTSLRKLKELPGNYRVFPGHGESTTLAWEQKTNPYMR